MLTKVLALAAAGAIWSAATSASAEQITLRCTQTVSESYELTDGQVANSQTPRPDVVIEIDTETGQFSIGATRGQFTLTDQTFIGLAYDAPFYGAWD